jgi:hypothetical protein
MLVLCRYNSLILDLDTTLKQEIGFRKKKAPGTRWMGSWGPSQTVEMAVAGPQTAPLLTQL